MRQLALTIIAAGYMQHAMESERQSMQRGFRYKRKKQSVLSTHYLKFGMWKTDNPLYIIISETCKKSSDACEKPHRTTLWGLNHTMCFYSVESPYCSERFP